MMMIQPSGFKPVEMSLRYIELNGELHILCIARDISQHVELERKLEERNRQLADQNQRIREKGPRGACFISAIQLRRTAGSGSSAAWAPGTKPACWPALSVLAGPAI